MKSLRQLCASSLAANGHWEPFVLQAARCDGFMSRSVDGDKYIHWHSPPISQPILDYALSRFPNTAPTRPGSQSQKRSRRTMRAHVPSQQELDERKLQDELRVLRLLEKHRAIELKLGDCEEKIKKWRGVGQLVAEELMEQFRPWLVDALKRRREIQRERREEQPDPDDEDENDEVTFKQMFALLNLDIGVLQWSDAEDRFLAAA